MDANDADPVELLRRSCVEQLSVNPSDPLPAQMIKEIRRLAESMGMNLPLVDDPDPHQTVGSMKTEYYEAALVSARLIAGTLYDRYYDINARKRFDLDAEGQPRERSLLTSAFLHHSWITDRVSLAYQCRKRINLENCHWGHFGQNSAILEQLKVLTTRNLAVLFDAADLDEHLKENLPEMAKGCFSFVVDPCSRWPNPLGAPAHRLPEKEATAWCQMIFFLSRLPEEKQTAFLIWADDLYGKQSEDFRRRFTPFMRGLKAAIRGKRPAQPRRSFMGWQALTLRKQLHGRCFHGWDTRLIQSIDTRLRAKFLTSPDEGETLLLLAYIIGDTTYWMAFPTDAEDLNHFVAFPVAAFGRRPLKACDLDTSRPYSQLKLSGDSGEGAWFGTGDHREPVVLNLGPPRRFTWNQFCELALEELSLKDWERLYFGHLLRLADGGSTLFLHGGRNTLTLDNPDIVISALNFHRGILRLWEVSTDPFNLLGGAIVQDIDSPERIREILSQFEVYAIDLGGTYWRVD